MYVGFECIRKTCVICKVVVSNPNLNRIFFFPNFFRLIFYEYFFLQDICTLVSPVKEDNGELILHIAVITLYNLPSLLNYALVNEWEYYK